MNRRAPRRLATLQRLQILDSPIDRRFEDLVARLAVSLNVPICLINILDAERDWVKASIGLDRKVLPIDTSFCEAFFETNVDLVISEDTTDDLRFWKNPYVLGPPYVRFYVAARLIVDGETIGTICALDLAPRKLAEEQFTDMRCAARQIIELVAADSRCSVDAP